MVPEAGIEPARLAAGDFESPASTNFTTRADCEVSDYDIFLSGFGGASFNDERAVLLPNNRSLDQLVRLWLKTQDFTKPHSRKFGVCRLK